jgi:hypothetical protein
MEKIDFFRSSNWMIALEERLQGTDPQAATEHARSIKNEISFLPIAILTCTLERHKTDGLQVFFCLIFGVFIPGADMC